jgi:hypothetical protein
VKYIRFFESFEKQNYWAYEDNFLRIHKILNPPNNGKILFRFYDEKSNDFNIKYSMMAGCAKLLGTKYENNPEVRSITLGNRFREVKVNTMDSIFRNFLVELGYERQRMFGDSLAKELRNEFGDYLQKIPSDAKNLGDIIDGLKELQSIVEPYVISKRYNL